MTRALIASLLVLALFAGCFGGDNDDGSTSDDDPSATVGQPGTLYAPTGNLTVPVGGLFAGPALYDDPQNAPHPAFNWPTMTHPAVGPNVPRYWQPIPAAEIPDAITDLSHVVQTPGVASGAGVALFGSLAVVPGYGDPTAVVDISDPTAPVVLSKFESQLGDHRGATIIAYPDGRLVTVISTSSGLDVWEITDPTMPANLTPIATPSHKVGVIPGTPIVMNARSNGGNETTDAQTGVGGTATKMWDFSDPESPVELPEFNNGYGCHHIYFWNNLVEEKYRSVCAGIEYTQIIDTADPYNPSVIVSVPYGHGMTDAPSGSVPLAAFSHYAGLSRDGTILLVGDEHGGGLGPIGCTVGVDTPAGRASAPIGAVWFYDVSTETDPQFKGYISASQLEKMGVENPTQTGGLASSCTAHHGRLVPYQDRDVLAMSFYGAGVVVIDFTAVRGEVPGLAEVVAQYSNGSNTWETWYYQGYFFTGDLNRGMDILTLV